jgi:hypothetical protein
MDEKNQTITLEVKNEELEVRVDAYLKEKTPENLNKLIDRIVRSRILVPANAGADHKPQPCLITNPENGSFLPVYTSLQQVPKEPRSTGVINMPYLNANNMVADGTEVAGIVINPFTQNLVFKRALVEKIKTVEAQREADAKRIPLTPEQYLVFERKQFEFGHLPRNFFTRGKELIDELCEKKENFIDELFEEGYQQNRMYPYLPEDFSVMVMNISDNFVIVRVDLPKKDIGTPSCRRVYLTWDDKIGSGKYLTIERTKKEEVNLLGEFVSDGRHIDHGEAPAEGAELQRIIDLHQEQGA